MNFMDKPRIVYGFSILLKQKQWFCKGNGYLGMGDTPVMAYWDWRVRVKQDLLRLGLVKQ